MLFTIDDIIAGLGDSLDVAIAGDIRLPWNL
jgi:hypothetical protein